MDNDMAVVENDEIDLLALWAIIWKEKITLISVTLAFAILSVFYALYLPDIYRSDVTLFPSKANSESSNGDLGAGLTGIANLAGMNMSSGENSKTVLALEILESRKFIIEFITNHNIKPALFALKKWDKKTGEETFGDQMYDQKQNKWLVDPETKMSLEPTDLEAYELFKSNLLITTEMDTDVVVVSFDSVSPIRAKEWLDLLIKDLNASVRNKDVRLTDKSIKFLEMKLGQTQIVDIQKIFFKLIEGEVRKKLLAETVEEYVFETIDPAFIPEIKVSPKRILICILGTVLGGLFGLFIVFVKYLKNKEPNKSFVL